MNNSTKPCTRASLFAAVHAAVRDEALDVAMLVEQTGHSDARVREIAAILSILADAEAVVHVTGVSLAQALTARRQAIDAAGGAS